MGVQERRCVCVSVGWGPEARLLETPDCCAFGSELPHSQKEKVSYLVLTGKEGKVALSVEY